GGLALPRGTGARELRVPRAAAARAGRDATRSNRAPREPRRAGSGATLTPLDRASREDGAVAPSRAHRVRPGRQRTRIRARDPEAVADHGLSGAGRSPLPDSVRPGA